MTCKGRRACCVPACVVCLVRLPMCTRTIIIGICLLVSWQSAFAQSQTSSGVRVEVFSTAAAQPVSGRDVEVRRALDVPSTSVAAQPTATSPVYRTQGREFYVAFPAVVGSSSYAQQNIRRLIFSARSRTAIRIRFLLRNFDTTILAAPNALTSFDVPLWGTMSDRESEIAVDKGILIESEDVISVYGYSHDVMSTDGFLVLPKESLGKEYLIPSLRNALSYGIYPTPRSSLTILATEDSTTVQFRLTANSHSGRLRKDSVYTLLLNRGEVFPIFAKDTGDYRYFPSWDTVWLDSAKKRYRLLYYEACVSIPTGWNPDLTGSDIRANKPIAVFSGHERASSGDELELDPFRAVMSKERPISRDHLVEQIPPVSLWGDEFIVPVYGEAQMRPRNADVIRILSGGDYNEIRVNGSLIATLNRGEYRQFTLSEACHIKTTESALVVSYMETAACSDCFGDPDMTLIQPISNYAKRFTLPLFQVTTGTRDSYAEYRLNLLVHKDAYAAARVNGNPLKQHQLSSVNVQGTDYLSVILAGEPREWRIESPMPCWAESYAYGRADSYTFAGGGSFRYHDSLSAENLDFQTVLVSRTKLLTAEIKAGLDLDLFEDSIEVRGIKWMSGDTNYFELLDPITTPIKLGPNGRIPVRFKFNPAEVRQYTARAWVWSTSRQNVYIDVVGEGGLLTADINPKVVNFGRVRVGQFRDTTYSVTFSGDANLDRVRLIARSYSELLVPALGFQISDVIESFWEAGTAFTDRIRFQPMTEGWRDTAFTVYAALPQSPNQSEKLRVQLIGRGVEPRVVVPDHVFQPLRVGKASNYVDIEIRNLGSDTTVIKSIKLADGNTTDFAIDPTSLPVTVHTLDTTDVPRSRFTIRVRFNPTETGERAARIRVETLEGELFSTIRGIGIEPYVISNPQRIDFGDILAPQLPVTPKNPTAPITIHNIGTDSAKIYELIQTEKGKLSFVLSPIAPDSLQNITLAVGDSVNLQVEFKVDSVGDFYDTVFVRNDSRNEPVHYLHARVISEQVVIPARIDFDTVTDCDPVVRILEIENTSSVAVVITDIRFGDPNSGFKIVGTPFQLPLKIASGSKYPIPIQYEFPPNLLNGSQTETIYITQFVGDEIIELQTTLTVERKIRILSLSTIPPSFTPNAGDILPFRLPILIVGGFEGLSELNNFELRLKFDNDLFEPVGYDLSGSLTEKRSPSDPGRVTAIGWDEASRTYTIVGNDLDISGRGGTNVLLTVLVRAFVTRDTEAVVTPELVLSKRPCAYGIEQQGIRLVHADECGDPSIRKMLQGKKIALTIEPSRPDPIVASDVHTARFHYQAAQSLNGTMTVVDALGRSVATLPFRAEQGEGNLEIPVRLLDASGVYLLKVEAFDSAGKVGELAVPFRVVR